MSPRCQCEFEPSEGSRGYRSHVLDVDDLSPTGYVTKLIGSWWRVRASGHLDRYQSAATDQPDRGRVTNAKVAERRRLSLN